MRVPRQFLAFLAYLSSSMLREEGILDLFDATTAISIVDVFIYQCFSRRFAVILLYFNAWQRFKMPFHSVLSVTSTRYSTLTKKGDTIAPFHPCIFIALRFNKSSSAVPRIHLDHVGLGVYVAERFCRLCSTSAWYGALIGPNYSSGPDPIPLPGVKLK